ncbi:MAG: hypothetical protein ABSB15_06805 [Bryobacteraceae bacterium]|jgi:hypothetical protein
MRPLFAFGLAVLCCAGLAAQAASAQARSSAGALGGTYGSIASSRPLGGVALPTFPSAAGARRKKATTTTAGYTPIFYIPNYYDASYDAAPSNYLQTPPPTQQPIIINQYFNSSGPDDRAAEDDRQPQSQPDDVSNPGDPIGVPQNYYLIAYRDHTVYPALAYWVEGDTLHYVTTQNTHNQASLALIDLEQTTKLNADRAIPFSIPGK